ncbi:MAG: hypothetical protein K8U57_18620 [Planctomycetes bacterium]|nr:hypothetical protein [Planctomycetota bacterium]
MLLREFVGGDPPHSCKLMLIDDPTGFGHRVLDGGQMVEHVLTQSADFERATAAKMSEGFTETERSLTRRIFVNESQFWIVWLDGVTIGTQVGGLRVKWKESVGQTRVKEFRERDRAVAAYHRVIAAKQAEGYREESSRAVAIADMPNTPLNLGKKKAR